MNTLSMVTDHELIAQFASGKTSAMNELLNRYKDRIFSSIYFMVKDKYLAEDLFQEVFIKVIDTIKSGRYTEEGKFLPWALRIAHNLCVDHFRKIKRTPVIKTGDNQDLFEAFNFEADTAESKMMRSQSHEKVRVMLEMLPEEQREVIILRHYADLSFKEIADLTKCSINTALGRMRYGLLNLRKIMTEKHVAL
jgi:RNA polymerase sigma factor (sigma-70 family)